MPPQQENDQTEKGDRQAERLPEVEPRLSAALWQAPELQSLPRVESASSEDGDAEALLDGFGLAEHQPDQVIGKALDQVEVRDMRDDVRPSGSDIVDAAQHLGEQYPERWHDRPGGPGKCNLFLDAALRAADVKLPWGDGNVPSVHQMRRAFEDHPDDWERVYSDGPGNDFRQFETHPGDAAIWDKTVTPSKSDPVYNKPYHVEHCGFIDEDGWLHYAGSRDTQGYRSLPIDGFVDSPHYKEPSAVFRYKHLRD